MKNKIYIHFSVDDVFKSLIEVTDKNIPLKKHWFFSQIYNLWKNYKIRTGLYLFYKGKINGKMRYLTEVKNLKNELKEKWIYFGPHALDFNSPPHKFSLKQQKIQIQKIYDQIDRFAGLKNLAKKVRLHEYSECYELADLFKKYNVNTLFTTDREVGAHRLPIKNRKELIKRGNTNYKHMNFIRTNFRVENLKKNIKLNQIVFDRFFKKKKTIIIYSHEYELKKEKVKKLLKDNISLISKKFILISKKP